MTALGPSELLVGNCLRRNLLYMRSMSKAWPEREDFVQRPVAQLPWGHIVELLTKLTPENTATGTQ